MTVAATNLWVFNFQLAVQRGDYRAAKCILINQQAVNPSLNWRRYITPKQADVVEATIIAAPIAPEPVQSVSSYKKRGDDHIITITAGDRTVVMTNSELKAAGQAARQEARKRKRSA